MVTRRQRTRLIRGAQYGVFVLGLVAAAYMAETIRAGIQAVPRGQTEAAVDLASLAGLAYGWVYMKTRRILAPAVTHALVDVTWVFFFRG